MRRLTVILLSAVIFICFANNGFAFLITFEENEFKDYPQFDVVKPEDSNPLKGYPGITFQFDNMRSAYFADVRSGKYKAYSDDKNVPTGLAANTYHLDGYFAIWAGTGPASRTRNHLTVGFTEKNGTRFGTAYSSQDFFHMDTYLSNGEIIKMIGAPNKGQPKDFLTLITSGSTIDHVLLYSTANENEDFTQAVAPRWMIDDINGNDTGVIPEPSSILLLAGGLFTFLGYRRFRRI